MLWGIHARAKFLAMTKPTHKALSTRTCMCLCVCVCRAECLCTHLCEYVNIYAITNGSVNTIATHINNPNIFWQMLELVLFGFWTLELDYNAWLMIADKKNHFNLLRGFFFAAASLCRASASVPFSLDDLVFAQFFNDSTQKLSQLQHIHHFCCT